MNTAEFLESILKSGITLSVVSGELKVKGDRKFLSPAILHEIKARKSEIIDIMDSQEPKPGINAIVEPKTAQPVHRQYKFPNGETVTLSEDEFRELIEIFRLLHSWRYEKSI